MKHRLRELISDLEDRLADAVVSRSRIVNAPLRQFLRERVSRPAGAAGGFLADPVFEAAFGWEQASETMQELSASGLLNPALLASLAKSTPIDEENRKSRNTFPSDRRPFTHQLKAWQTLGGKEIKSVVVSSGTGSGKTEAFLVPILDSLARQQEAGGRLVGVQALMLYPLNALIASQQDRFADWTEPFGGNIRFCLYNGNTPERLREGEQSSTPWEVRDRKSLRASPPPILVTNATMLEYMLIRSADAPILAASRGKLRWVVLDEAHTYVGSQAAEMTLLLRRTLHAFGVKPSDVRFIATSATLGEGEEARLQLKRFLADLAGTDEGQVESIEGHRLVPEVSPHDDDYSGIALVPSAISIRQRLAERPATLSELSDKAPPGQTLEWLESCANSTNRRGDAFLPLRLHLFLRSHAGVWACLNQKCAGREGTPLQAPAWPYGKAFERDTPQCDICGSLTCEVLLCDDCGSAFLDVATDGGWQKIERWREERAFDEFLADADEVEEGDEEEPDSISTRHILGPPSIPGGTQISVDSTSGGIRDRATESVVAWALFERSSCPCCGAGGATRRLFRSLRLGGPFMVGTAANVLLDRTPERIPATADMPFGGRQLITFTDNRQGTARFAAKWQQDSERNYFRSIIYHALHAAGSSEEGEIRNRQDELRALEPLAPSNPTIAAMVERIRAELKSLETVGAGLTWGDLRSQLAAANRDQRELLDLWKDRDPRFGAADELATLQLFTEFLRRPVRTNSLESMGVAAIQFAVIERLTEADLPALFREHSATIQDWKDYLYLLLTFFIRANSVVHIDDGLRWWVGQRIAPKSAYAPDYDGPFASAHIGWPRLVGGGGRASRPILLLRDGLKLDLNDRGVREQVNETLRQAYASLTPLRVGAAADFKLDLTKAAFTKVTNAWLCPVTGRILDRTFRGLTPYLSQIPNSRPISCKAAAMPHLPAPWLRHENGTDARQETITWLKSDGAVATLRKEGIWTDLHDRLVLRNPFIRVVEHSAQQPSSRLRAFERDFKLGRINVLSCSTTMEMGVDIGGISTVLMTNVPPSPASYRQRVGRAGRRNEALSVAFAYCSDSPLGWTTFDDPKRPLKAQIAPPRVALESRPIVQRHVNAFLLGYFLRTQAGLEDVSRTGLETEWFFSPDLAMEAPCAKFASWIRNPGDQREELASGVSTIVSRTALQQHPNLYEECIETLEPIVETWTAEYRTLRGDLEASVDQAAKIALGLQLKRLAGEFLLTHLAQAGFLPGHGFPTDVVPFIVHSPAELRASGRNSGRRDDGVGRSRG
jgi:DEAD/DEAH box helicase domain-containing protein